MLCCSQVSLTAIKRRENPFYFAWNAQDTIVKCPTALASDQQWANAIPNERSVFSYLLLYPIENSDVVNYAVNHAIYYAVYYANFRRSLRRNLRRGWNVAYDVVYDVNEGAAFPLAEYSSALRFYEFYLLIGGILSRCGIPIFPFVINVGKRLLSRILRKKPATRFTSNLSVSISFIDIYWTNIKIWLKSFLSLVRSEIVQSTPVSGRGNLRYQFL